MMYDEKVDSRVPTNMLELAATSCSTSPIHSNGIVCVETSSIRHKVTSYPAFRKGSKKAMSFSSVEMYTRFFPLRRSKGSTLRNILDASILVSRYLAASGYHFQTYWNTAQRGHRTENHHVEYVETYTCPGLPFGPHPLRRVHKCLGGSELCRALNV
eukprot:m.72154 g.72154  ORF g.72154 m.72154 type:complete len:157 (-) comp10097_c0_seq1:1024-1494(-)